MKKLPEHGGNYIFYDNKVKLDFSININPLGYPEGLKNYLIENFESIKEYPEIYAESLISKLSQMYNCSAKNLLCGNGSVQFIYIFPVAFNIKHAVIVAPNFSEYEKSIRANKGVCIYFYLKEKDEFNLNIDNLIDFLNEYNSLLNYQAIFLCNPSNPCGTLTKKEEIKEILKFSKKNDKLLIIDEAFIDFTDDLGMIFENYKNLIVLRSFTKNFGIPGLRLGICKSAIPSIERIKKFLHPWSLNSFSILAGKYLLNCKDFLKKSRDYVNREKRYLIEKLREINNIKVYNSQTNYLLIKILNEYNAFDLQKYLLKKGILIRNCANFSGLNKKFFRIAVKTREENMILLNELRNFFNKGAI